MCFSACVGANTKKPRKPLAVGIRRPPLATAMTTCLWLHSLLLGSQTSIQRGNSLVVKLVVADQFQSGAGHVPIEKRLCVELVLTYVHTRSDDMPSH